MDIASSKVIIGDGLDVRTGCMSVRLGHSVGLARRCHHSLLGFFLGRGTDLRYSRSDRGWSKIWRMLPRGMHVVSRRTETSRLMRGESVRGKVTSRRGSPCITDRLRQKRRCWLFIFQYMVYSARELLMIMRGLVRFVYADGSAKDEVVCAGGPHRVDRMILRCARGLVALRRSLRGWLAFVSRPITGVLLWRHW